MKELKRLRIEFVIVVMGIVVVFLMTIFSIQYYSSQKEMSDNIMKALEIAIDEKDNQQNNKWRDNQWGGRPEDGQDMHTPEPAMDDFGDRFNRVSVLLVRVSEDGSMETVRNDMFYMENSYIEEIFEATPYSEELSKSSDSGKIVHGELSDYSLRYGIKRDETDGYIYIAYADVSSDKTILSSMLKRSILISLGVIIVMFGLSIVFSKKVLKPVEKAWEDQKRFVADASHELKTPLAVILSNTDMMMKSKDRNSDRNGRRLDNIKIESERMKELVQELLEIARGDMSDKEFIKEDVNFSELVDEELLVWDPTYFEAGKSLESSLDEDIHINGDPVKLRRLVGILVDNALKYSCDASTVKVSLSRNAGTSNHKKNHVIRLAVENKGNALSKEECNKIFERFYRADKSRESTSGYGLGLSIAVSIVEEHKGSIRAESDGVNTNTFVVEF
ncbi:MAG: HAMP domain-containing histidine kinase [Eubacterium sp.]|nr:HAMP domain-containing histidine kinase [Eubacterium sp.]